MPRDKEQRPACSTSNAAVPDEVNCANCGDMVEMWSDELEARCAACGNEVSR